MTETPTIAELTRLRDLLTRREADRKANDLLRDATDLVAATAPRPGQGLSTSQLGNLAEVAHTRGSVADMIGFIRHQSGKESSKAAWVHGKFADELVKRLGTSSKPIGLIERTRNEIVAAVEDQLRSFIAPPIEESLADSEMKQWTSEGQRWREDLVLPLARRYLGYIVAEYRLSLGTTEPTQPNRRPGGRN